MTKPVKLGLLCLWTVVAVVFGVIVMWGGGFLEVPTALSECLAPVTFRAIYLPVGCAQTNETPPADLMGTVENQARLSGAKIRRIIVCRTADRLVALERHAGGLHLGDQETDCRPVAKGCCSCQIGRHVVVMATEPRDSGSVLLRADLIQSRWDHVRASWDKRQRDYWFWWWPLAGAVILLIALHRIWVRT